jgi:hypothetical protein
MKANMTQDEVIDMAREAGFKMENSAAIQAAKAFYKLATAQEREACAKVVLDNNHMFATFSAAKSLAEGIRARGES